MSTAANRVTLPLSGYRAEHFRFAVADRVATITLDRPERKNPLTFGSYDELAELFRAAVKDASGVRAFVLAGSGGNFCSGGDVHDIIGPLVEMDTAGLLEFTKKTGELVKAMRACPQPIVAAVDGIRVGAGEGTRAGAEINVSRPHVAERTSFIFSGLPSA
jgi:enoyl-CoA hydratase/carnithine racemase